MNHRRLRAHRPHCDAAYRRSSTTTVAIEDSLLRTVTSVVLALCAALGAQFLYSVLTNPLESRAMTSVAGGMLYVSVSYLIGGLAAGAVLGRLIESPVPVWWAFRFSVVLALLGIGAGTLLGPPTDFGFLSFIAGLLPYAALVVGATVGATWTKPRSQRSGSVDARHSDGADRDE